MIKSKKDAKELVEKIKKCEVFTFYNEEISMEGHGTTDYSYEKNGRFSGYNFGRGWEDQGRTYFDEEEFLKVIWNERKSINKALKSGQYEFI